MYVNYAITLLFLLLATACQPGGQNKNQQSTSALDSIISDTIVSMPPPVKQADPYELQILAQDTLFEDGSQPSPWKDAGFNDPAGFKRFMIRFKEWVRTDNADSIAAYIDFPVAGVKTAAQFKNQYATIFDAKLKDIVEKQRLDQIFRNYKGAMLGDGAIWFEDTGKKGYRVIAINK